MASYSWKRYQPRQQEHSQAFWAIPSRNRTICQDDSPGHIRVLRLRPRPLNKRAYFCSILRPRTAKLSNLHNQNMLGDSIRKNTDKLTVIFSFHLLQLVSRVRQFFCDSGSSFTA